jgi:hypothetical protein
MITLKTVLLGTSAVGALAIGGVTYATVSAQSPDLKSDAAQAVPAKPAPAAPAPVPAAPKPKCVPQVPDAGKAVPEAGKAVPDVAGQARDTVQQQAGKAGQAVEQKVNEAQGAPNTQPRTLPKALPEGATKPGVPGTDCVPEALPKNAKPNLPAKPQVPSVPELGAPCDKVQPAIPVGTPLERSVILSHGLGHATKHVGVVTYKAHKLCHVTQKWTGSAGQWLQVERLQAPAQGNIQQLRQALQLPVVGGTPTTIGGQQGWVSPLGGSVLWYGGDGFALYLTGSPAMAPELQDVAGQLQQAQHLAQ